MNRIVAMLGRWKDVLVLAGFFLGIGGFLVKPYAESFVKDTVNDRIATLEKQLADLSDSETNAKIGQARQESDLASVKAILKELLDLELSRSGHQP